MPLFTIIVPVYNAAAYIEQCIQSIVNQSFSNFELLLVDDGSTDASYALCKKWKEKDTRIDIFHQDNRGASAARNVGINNARGRYIQFVDADDTLESDCLQTLADLIQQNGEPDFVEFKLHYWGPRGINNIQGTNLKDGFYDRAYIEKVFLPVMLQIYRDDTLYYGVFNVLRVIKKELIDINAIRFNESIRRWEDWLFALEVFGKAQNMVVSRLPMYNYFGHESGGLGGRYNPDTYKFLSMTYAAVDQLFLGSYDTFSEYAIACRMEQYERCINEIFQYEKGENRQRLLEEVIEDVYFRKLILSSSRKKGIFIIRPFLVITSTKCAVFMLSIYISLSKFWGKTKVKLRKFYYLVKKGKKN